MSRVDDALDEYRKGSIPHYLYASTAASEYAKLRDETPITEDWAAKVRSLGVTIDYSQNHDSWYLSAIGKRILGGRSAIAGYVNTKGDARSLLLAAGIECEV